MPGKDNQKLKVIYVLKLFEEKTDYNHPITMPEIVAACRKSR